MSANKKKTESVSKNSMKLSDHQQVVEYINNLEHPLKKEIEEVREIILSANSQLTEHIKWNAPSFVYKNEDRVTFNLHGKGYFRLIFHYGAKVKDIRGKGNLIKDDSGLLDWVAVDRAIIKFTDMNDVKAKQEKLVDVIAKWLEVQNS